MNTQLSQIAWLGGPALSVAAGRHKSVQVLIQDALSISGDLLIGEAGSMAIATTLSVTLTMKELSSDTSCLHSFALSAARDYS